MDDERSPHAPPGRPARGGHSEWRQVRLPFRPPLALDDLLGFFGVRSVPGVEQVADGCYTRSVRLPGGPAVVAVAAFPPAGPDEHRVEDRAVHRPQPVDPPPVSTAEGPGVWVGLLVQDPADVSPAVAACRRAFDLDADPVVVDAALAADRLLAPSVAASPGRRAPGHVDPEELAVRAVLGQQVSLLAARRLAGRLVDLCGDPLPTPVGGVTMAFPTAAAIAEADLDRIGMPGTRRTTLRTLAQRLAAGDIRLGPDADPDEAERRLLEIRGIGPWTAAYVRMRGLGDRDVVLTTDLGVRHALDRLGAGGVDPATLARRWSPWGSYAVQHLWAGLAAP